MKFKTRSKSSLTHMYTLKTKPKIATENKEVFKNGDVYYIHRLENIEKSSILSQINQ